MQIERGMEGFVTGGGKVCNEWGHLDLCEGVGKEHR
jgi:hypothetical protein